MRTVRIFGIVSLVSSLLLVPWGGSGAAEKKFPFKPIQVIIPFQPGDTDNLLRPYVEKAPEYLRQPVSMVYKPGAAGAVGAGFVASSKADGYTLVGSSQSSIVVVPLTQKAVGYTWESFAPVSCLVETASMLVVQSSAPWKDLKELVEDSRKSPGKITYSSSGTFGTNHLIPEALCKEAGIKWTYIPSQGSGPTITALLGGHVQVASTALTPAHPHLKSGSLRPIAVYNSKRVQSLPQVPALLECGYSIGLPGIYGVLAPRATPKEVIEILHHAFRQITQEHKGFLNERLESLGAQVCFADPEEYTSMLKKQHETFQNILIPILADLQKRYGK